MGNGNGSTAIAKRQSAVGSYHDPQAATNTLQRASEVAHLVSPATSVGAIPDGCEIAITSVRVDVERETYPIPGRSERGLSKTALDRIAGGVGVAWNPNQSRRLDDGSHPHYCHYRAVGHYRTFDGQVMTIVGGKIMDLRDGSAMSDGMKPKELRMQRMHILSHAETKARLRAIRSMGVRTGYDPKELQKPFVMARVAFTGRSEDPEARAEYRRMTAASMLGGAQALYGPSHEQPAARPQLEEGTPPPPVSDSPADEDDLPPIEAEHDAEYEEAPSTAQAPPSSGLTIPGGRSKGTPLEDAEDSDLEYWHRRISDALEEGSTPDRFRQRDQELAAAMGAELERRRGGSGSQSEQSEEGDLF